MHRHLHCCASQGLTGCYPTSSATAVLTPGLHGLLTLGLPSNTIIGERASYHEAVLPPRARTGAWADRVAPSHDQSAGAS